MFGLGSIISIKTTLGIVRSEIEKQLERDVDKFDMVYKAKNHSIAFKIDGELYAFEDSSIADAVKDLTANEIKSGDTLDLVIAHYERDTNTMDYADIYFRNSNGEKLTIKYNY